MGGRLLFLFLLMLGTSIMVVGARVIDIADDKVVDTNYERPEVARQSLKKNELCSLCEEYTSLAVDYLSQNKTQTEIIDALHQACSRLHSFNQQCILLVDYYTPLFFQDVGLVSPDKFCTKMNLCNEAYVSLLKHEDTCAICHDTISEFLTKLKDPDTELDIIENLLKLCNKVEKYTQKCKKLVFEYGPVILINAESFFEKTDICAYIPACKSELAHQDA